MSTIQHVNTISSSQVQLKDRAHDVVVSLKNLGIAIFRLLCEMQVDFDMRQRMKHLDDRILEDIGKTRAEVDAEASKPFWHK